MKEAYRFLVENYQVVRLDEDGSERDQIFLFGFSRGAYSARVLAGFIHAFGLMEPRNLNLLDYAYRAYKRIGENRANSFGEMRLYERVLRPDRPPIRLLALFDSVSSVFEHGRYLPRLRFHAFTAKNRSVETVRHAVAIDERRTMFQAQLWPEGGDYRRNRFADSGVPQDAREMWFTGVHGDVSGGYPEEASALAKLPLEWIIDETKPTGLHYNSITINEVVLGQNAAKPYVAPDPLAKRNRSMSWAWAIVEFIPRRRSRGSKRWSFLGITIPFFARRSIPENAWVHRSVITRMKATGERPKNLPAVYRTP